MYFVAHLIQRVVFLGGGACKEIPLWENLVLIQAETADSAYSIAEQLGIETQDLEGFTCDGRPAELRFAGIRKLVSIVEDRLDTGVELSYFQMEVSSEDDLAALLQRKPVQVNFDDSN